MAELVAPQSALLAKDGDEVLRLWIAGGDSHITINFGVFGEDELRVWGMLLADAAAHIVRAASMQQDESAAEGFALLEAGFRERLQHNPTLTGAFDGKAFH